MILERIDVIQLRSDSIGEAQPVARRAVVIAGRKSLDVQPTDSTGRENHRLRSHHHLSVIVEILKYGACSMPVVVAEQFNGRAEFQELNLLIQDLVFEDTHDL